MSGTIAPIIDDLHRQIERLRLELTLERKNSETIRAAEREACLSDLDAALEEIAPNIAGEVWIVQRLKARIRARSETGREG